jgi:4-aminobutyrate aminotransferase-like enzyme
MGVAPEPDPKLAKHVSEHLRDQELIVGVGGFHKNVMRVQPPLTISRDQLETVVEGLREAIEASS